MTTYDEYGIPAGAYSESKNLAAQARKLVRAFFLHRILSLAREQYYALRRGGWRFKRLFTLVNALVVAWWLVLYWGERSVFNSAVESCTWERWEKWEAGANPHRLIFVADPQLIDPHTYPDRPRLLNRLTYQYTDLYLRRAFSRLQVVLYPDTVFFLGDLFDGGREWSTGSTTSPDFQFRKYGNDFWLREYARFSNLFFKHWGDGGGDARPGQPGRKIISSLPGNHDLGFARGVQIGVRNRFNAYFGDGNRIDVIANHTFVSIDSVSLSALSQDSPDQVEDLWRPTQDFLESVKERKKRLIQRELRLRKGLQPYPGFLHYDIPFEDLAKAELPRAKDDITEFPTILLSHVPLYRNPGVPCGPLREHWPPSPPSAGQPPGHDDRNAIAVRGGYQYQNVLDREITADLARKIGDIRYAFSGDDHDYCEVLHRGYDSAGRGIQEITVKSISWAMGIRLPGVVLASLWNPVDSDGNPLSGDASKTVQTHLCLLPDQIGTFIKYMMLFGLTLALLAIRAALITAGLVSAPLAARETQLLPICSTPTSSAESEKALLSHPSPPFASFESHASDRALDSANSSASSERGGILQVRSAQARTRSLSPNGSAPLATPKYPYPLVQHAGYYGPAYDHDREDGMASGIAKPHERSARRNTNKAKRRKGHALFMHELWSSLVTVLCCGFAWYIWLVWRG